VASFEGGIFPPLVISGPGMGHGVILGPHIIVANRLYI